MPTSFSTNPSTPRELVAQWVTAEAFQPYGQVITASEDGKLYDETDAQLSLEQGIPRFYIMRLWHQQRQFARITRHVRCTQCLGSLECRDWFIAVAPASTTATPDLGAIAAFRIPGNCFIKLHVGTWHAGPFFDQDYVDFYNLELSDTNITDHETYNLKELAGIEFVIAILNAA